MLNVLTYIRFACPINLRQLSLRKPQVLISKAHRHTSYLVVVLIEYYSVFIRSFLSVDVFCTGCRLGAGLCTICTIFQFKVFVALSRHAHKNKNSRFRFGNQESSFLSLLWCHQLFNRVIEWWCTGIYIFILRGLKENLHVNLQKLF